tara:strand:- start:166 stop:474 length:309 start_codon:yes stop_codon:yes gene_type:complete
MQTFEYIILTLADHTNSNKIEIESHCVCNIANTQYNTGATKCVLKFVKRAETLTCMSSLTRYSESEIISQLSADEWNTGALNASLSASNAIVAAAELIDGHS